MIEGVIVKKLTANKDERGWLTEIFRQDEIDFEPVMSYVSVTLPGVVRGPHEHKEQSDCFVFIGPGDFSLHLWDNRQDSKTYGEKYVETVGGANKVIVIVPPGVVHGYKCVSSESGWVINLPNRLYRGEGKKNEVDEIRWEGKADSSFKIE